MFVIAPVFARKPREGWIGRVAISAQVGGSLSGVNRKHFLALRLLVLENDAGRGTITKATAANDVSHLSAQLRPLSYCLKCRGHDPGAFRTCKRVGLPGGDAYRCYSKANR
jgi:hypothetical protein